MWGGPGSWLFVDDDDGGAVNVVLSRSPVEAISAARRIIDATRLLHPFGIVSQPSSPSSPCDGGDNIPMPRNT